MARQKTIYICQECGFESPKWMGRCQNCEAWNTFQETVQEKRSGPSAASTAAQPPLRLDEIGTGSTERWHSPDPELDRALGGGIVPGSLILLGGEPGIGKSTLMLQLASRLEGRKVLYISGEESLQQIGMRARRIGTSHAEVYLSGETRVEAILEAADKLKPDLMIVDSVQTIYSSELESAVGTVSQIRDCTHLIQQFCKSRGIAVFVIGHITKQGAIAGPKVLEHIVDVVLSFEGDAGRDFRLLRTQKNRFGPTSEIGIYQMGPSGLIPVENPSGILLGKMSEGTTGTSVAVISEGMRTFLVEVQALVTQSVYSVPQRTCNGIEMRRMQMLLAVLEKRCSISFMNRDVFLNIVGGIRVTDPAVDLAVMVSIASSYFDKLVPAGMCFTGEVGLSGEIRPVGRLEERLKEAARAGFSAFAVSSFGAVPELKGGRRYQNIKELVEELFR